MLEYIINIITTSYNALITTTKWLIIFGVLLFFSLSVLIIKVKIEKNFERWLKKAKTKTWYKKLMIFVHGEEYYAEYETVKLPISHNKRRAEIKYKDKSFFYTKESNEIKLLDLLIQAKGEIVSHKVVAVELSMPRSYEVEMKTTGYKTDIYELVSNLRKLLRDELQIGESELNQLIITVKKKGYRIGNPKI